MQWPRFVSAYTAPLSCLAASLLHTPLFWGHVCLPAVRYTCPTPPFLEAPSTREGQGPEWSLWPVALGTRCRTPLHSGLCAGGKGRAGRAHSQEFFCLQCWHPCLASASLGFFCRGGASVSQYYSLLSCPPGNKQLLFLLH